MARQIDLDQLMKYPLRRESALCDEEHADPHFLNGVESVLEWAQTLPTLTPQNEPLTCEGCIHEHNEHENCNYCKRASYLGDYYYCRPPEEKHE